MTDPANTPAPAATRGLLLGVATVSAATLAVQVLQTRLFSVMLWHHLTYMVVTITLLGFAAGGSLLAVWPKLGRAHGDARVAVSTCCSLFGLTLILAFAILTHTATDTLELEKSRLQYFYLFLRYAYLVVPFLFAGLAVAISLQEFPASVHRTYFWNLMGSGVGAFLFLVLIRDLTGPGSLFFYASLGGLAGLMVLWGKRDHSSWPVRSIAVGSLALWPLSLLLPTVANELVPIRPAPSKALSIIAKINPEQVKFHRTSDPSYPDPEPSLATTLWTPTCRLDTIAMPQNPGDVAKDRADPGSGPRSTVHVFQDGDAPTVIWSGGYAADRPYDQHFYGLGYRLVKDPKVLIIGPGGGNDVETALHYGARDVTAVDINGDTLALVQGKFGAYTNDVYGRDRVRAVNSEGRSFLRREGETYDLLQMSGTDTYAALSSGSYVFAESYLYTEEAFDDFFAHMADDGVISVIRFRFEPPRETLKLVGTAARALRKQGVEDPSRHFIVVNQEDRQTLTAAAVLAQQDDPEIRELQRFFKEPMRYSFTIMRKTPFSAADVKTIEDALPPMNEAQPDIVTHTLYYGAGHRTGAAGQGSQEGQGSPEDQGGQEGQGQDLGTGQGASQGASQSTAVPADSETEYGKLLAAMAEGPDAEARFHAAYPYDTEPATDDRPFFFNFHSLGDVEWFGSSSDAGYEALTGSEPIGQYILVALLVQTTLATLLLVIAPLLRLGFASTGASSRKRLLLYFIALGLAYLLVEIVTIQRFVLYLGHPTYSLSAGLACFLVFSGLGSAVAGRYNAGRRLAAAAALVVVLLLAIHTVFLPDVLRQTLALDEPLRVAMTVAWIAPLAFAMGMPFPTGLALLRQDSAGLIPWAFGINGAASVLASILSIVVGMQSGFVVVLVVAGALYLLAAFTVPRTA